MPRFFTLLALLLSAVPATRSAPLGVTRTQGFTDLRITPHVIDPERPAQRKFGELRLLGAWRLESADARLGGISALAAEKDGLLAVSDTGTVMHIGLAGGVPATLRLHGLPGGPGRNTRKFDRDSEALAYDARVGRAWISFEQHHEVWRYGPGFARAEARRAISRPRKWPMNGGVEAMARLRDGRFVMFSESRGAPGGASDLLVYAGDPTLPEADPRVLAYLPPGPLQPTDAAVLADGRLLVLHRHISFARGVWAMLGVVEPGALDGTGPVRPRVLALWRPQATLDNMEALAVTREGGREILWVGSDDGFNQLQQTVLLKFTFAR